VRSPTLSQNTSSSIPQRAVFCDFDGTITTEETFVGMLKEFAPQLSAQLMPEMYALRLTLREGVRQLLESIPSARYPEIVEYAKTRSIRPGFAELLDFLDTHQVPFILVSGGVRCIVETVLGPLTKRMAAIYAVDLDTRGELMCVHSPFEEGTELVSKVKVMLQHPAEEQIAIGDSVTDLNMALHAPVVFARDRLIQYLDENQKPYIAWNDFFDVQKQLSQRWSKL
jgi:2-hydroxy-3-keto-5-methylthiopentenyl-1-phosphate phosphatase